MLLVDIAILVAIGAVVALAAGWLGGGSLGRLLEARRRRRLGERNLDEERRRLAERCVICDEPIDPAVDLWDQGQWWHRACWRRSIES